MQLTLAGKIYKYIRSKTKVNYGYHLTPTDDKDGVIAVEKTLLGKIELDTNIHEMLHACADFGHEEWVNQTAREIAAALWQLGYRKNDESIKTSKATSK